jgi:hypothetical protein
MRIGTKEWLVVAGLAACEASTGQSGSTMATVAPSPSKCIEHRDATFAAPQPDGLPVARVSGSSDVQPDDDTRHAIYTYGINKVVSSFTVCIDATGAVQKVDVLQTSCFPRYDGQVATKMRTWHFAALPADAAAGSDGSGGSAGTACGAVKFTYDQPDRPPDGMH